MQFKLNKLLESWRQQLGLRLSIFIMSITTLLFVATMAVCVYVTKDMTVKYATETTTKQMDDALEFIDANLNSVEQTLITSSQFANEYTSKPEDCYDLCKRILDCDTSVYAATIMFRPDYFRATHKEIYSSAEHHLFCPTAARQAGSKEYFTDNLTPFSDDDFNYIKEDSSWINTNKYDAGYWCEPYFDVYSTKELLITFSYPLHDSDGKIYAVLCTDVPLKWLSDRMQELKPTLNAKINIMTHSGHFLVHHIKELVQPKNGILAVSALTSAKQSNSKEYLDLTRKIMSGKRGHDSVKSTIKFTIEGRTDTIEPSFVYYAPIKKVGWYCSCMSPFSDINAVSILLTHRITLFAVIGFVLMIGALYFMVRRMVSPYKKFAAVDADIKTAAKIQMAMIPKEIPSAESLMNNQLSASIIPAKSVGGDLYDFLIIDKKLYFVVGDVSGKGVPASLFMAQTRTLFHVATERYTHPSDIITYINDKLSINNDLSMFVTMFAGVLDLATGMLTFCNGGHNAPVIIRGEKAEFMKVQTNIPVGVMEGMPYMEEELQMQRGDLIFVYTDGVTEAENIKSQLYGDDHLISFLCNKSTCTAQEVCDKVIADVRHHALHAEQSDDITLFCIKFVN